MNMERHKSDKHDAHSIYFFGKDIDAPVWIMPSKNTLHCAQLLSSIQLLRRTVVALTNHAHSAANHPCSCKDVVAVVEQMKKQTEAKIKRLADKLETLLKKEYPELLKNLLTIPSLGKQTVAYLLVITGGFTRVQNHRQLIAMAGTSPRTYESGISVMKRPGICKMGHSQLRRALYMCSMTAIRYNPACKATYERLCKAGKKPKVALIAVCNKLLKQACAIARSGMPYQEGHVSMRLTSL